MEGKEKQKKKSNKKTIRERTDSKKNRAKVVKEFLKDPMQSQRDIAKKAGVSKGTVTNKLGELGQTKDERILGICDTDIENVKLGQKLLKDRLIKFGSTLKVKEIVDIISEGTKRYTIFKGDITDPGGGLKDYGLNNEQRQKLLDRLLIDE